MKTLIISIAVISGLVILAGPRSPQKIFDVHVHGSADPAAQIKTLRQAGVYKMAISSSWDLQNKYHEVRDLEILYGLMFPCPEGRVPYSLQPCYLNGEAWPPAEWVETQLKEGKIDYLGEILNQYYGISSSDSALFPYYRLAENYGIPIGIHTGAAGPDHGSPDFKMEMGNPILLKNTLTRFPDLKVWIMHSGEPFFAETIALMRAHDRVYADISVISNPDIVPHIRFREIIKSFIDAGMEDRLMFGTDNANIEVAIASVEALAFLSVAQKDKLYYQNAEHFFNKNRHPTGK